MKKILSLLALSLLIISSNALSKEINFISTSWDEVLKTASSTGKPIFLDAYTDWCGWCKVMDKQTFSDEEVINFMAANFVTSRFEMETGQGKKLAMKYRVSAFPTFLIFNSKGKLIYETAGFQKPKDFLATLKKAIDPANQINYKGISDKIDLPFPDFYKSAFGKNGSPDKKFPDDKTVADYLNKQKDLFSEVNWSVISRFTTPEKINKHFLDNMDKYKELYGVSGVNDKFFSMLYSKLQAAVKAKDEKQLNNLLAMIDKYAPENKESNKEFYTINFYTKTGNWNKYTELIDKKIAKGEARTDEINEYSWTIYENTEDRNLIEKAIGWMKPIIEKEPDYAMLDTYAALLYKAKNFGLAKKYAEEAIKIGKETKENVEQTEKLLENINSNLK